MSGHLRNGLRLWITCIALTGLAACQSAPRSTTAGAAYVSDYRLGRYQQAYDGARRAADTGGSTRDEAEFVAGMSAYQLDRKDESLRCLIRLSDHRHESIAGPSAATVGLIYAERRQYARARTYFLQAIQQLDGEDQAQAYYHLASTEQKLELWSSARSHLSLALSRTGSEGLKDAIRQKMSTTSFTVQVGAFSSKSNAENQARSVGFTAQRAGLSSPAIVPTSVGDKTLFLVQVGSYASYDSATKAREKLGRTDAMVVPLAAN